MLDEYTDEFGTDLEGKIPEFNIPAQQGNVYQPNVPSVSPQPYTEPQYPNYQNQNYQQIPPQPIQPPQQPIYHQQYVYPPQQPPIQPIYQQPVPPPAPATPAARINSVFAGESEELNELMEAENNSGCLKNILFLFICLAVVVGSFGLSYMIGAKFILPDNKNIAPSFSVRRGLSKVKNLMNNTDILKNETAFTNYTAPVAPPPKPVIPPEVQYTPPAPPPAPKPVPAPAPVKPKPVAPATTMYRVVVGAFDTKQEAEDVAVNVRADGFPVYQYTADGKHRLQIGAFKSKALATALMKKAGEYGYNAYISIK